MRGALRQELVDQSVAVLSRLLNTVQHRLGTLGHRSSVDGCGDLVEVAADAVQRDRVCLDGLDQRAERIVLRAADQSHLAEGNGQGGVPDESGELLTALV